MKFSDYFDLSSHQYQQSAGNQYSKLPESYYRKFKNTEPESLFKGCNPWVEGDVKIFDL